MLAEPHQEHRPAGERDDSADAEEPAGIRHYIARAFKANRDAVGLEGGQQHRQVARILIHHLAALLALLLELLERRRHRGHQLNDDGGRDVRHDVESEDRHPVNAATGKHIEHAEDATRLGTEDLIPSRRIDAGQRDVGAEAVDQERAEREPYPLLELLGFC